jgi:hypothetical protein
MRAARQIHISSLCLRSRKLFKKDASTIDIGQVLTMIVVGDGLYQMTKADWMGS